MKLDKEVVTWAQVRSADGRQGNSDGNERSCWRRTYSTTSREGSYGSNRKLVVVTTNWSGNREVDIMQS